MLEPTHFGSNGAVAASVVELFRQETSAYSAMVRSVENFLSRQKMVSTPLVAMQLRPVICIYIQGPGEVGPGFVPPLKLKF